MDTVDKMVKVYCKEGAPKIFLRVLRKMAQNDLAQRLERDLQKFRPKELLEGQRAHNLLKVSAPLPLEYTRGNRTSRVN
ncbi:hypothetical protein AAFF_G00341990 [Aldrovandia affinis]|uniref:Uncharacterized protein n=1 Tax=Aldrovandia affinis TaxID=143900 RepID=A0AAD7VZM6_9TELE|nr:hypothetical protein AAFF_G00341990 [Aldrovandia affinis]